MRPFRALLASLVLSACAGDSTPKSDSAGANAPLPADAGTFAVADFQQLRWMNGMWRGFMPDGGKFYERYRVIDDSTMMMHAFPDSTFGTPSDSSRIMLRDGRVINDGGSARWVATRLDSVGVDFTPHYGAPNRFTWARESETQWSATMRWTDESGRPQTRTYALHKFGR
jgi:hypothetical protein